MKTGSKYPVLALLLGLISVGLGHVYVGRWKTGLGLVLGLVGAVVGVVAGCAVLDVGAAWPMLALFAVVPFFWIGQAVWAMRLARVAAGQVTSWPRIVLPYVAYGILIFLVQSVGLLRERVMENFRIPGGSMLPTLEIGDQITVVKRGDAAAPRRGELAVFYTPVGEPYIKRVVALEGDQVVVRGRVLYVNGEAVPGVANGDVTVFDRDGSTGPWHAIQMREVRETLGGRTYGVVYDPTISAGASDYGPFTVPGGTFFALGDNRDRSFDSRSFGPVPLESYIGRADSVWWSWGPEGLRLARLGLRL